MKQEIQETIEQVFPVSADAKLDIKNTRGSVQIKPGTEAEIKVTAIKYLDTGAVEATRLDIQQNAAGDVQVHTRHEKPMALFWKTRQACKVDYIIETPLNVALKVRTVSSTVAVAGLKGEFDIKTVSGEINISDLNGQMKIHSVSGKVAGTALSGIAEFDTISGNIALSDCQFSSLVSNTVSGRSQIATPVGAGPYRFKSVSGNVMLIVAEDTAAWVRSRSISGRFKTSLPATSYSSSGGKTKAALNGGGTEIRMNSISGNLYIVTSENEQASAPQVQRPSKDERMAVLTSLQSGELSIDDALTKLG